MESDESDPELVQSQVMETQQNPLIELEEEAAEEIDTTELKHCSVVLQHLGATKKELEEKEDMNRKGGKPVSRIPTFHKRPASANQNTELPVLRKDAPVPGVEPLEKAASGFVEAVKPKPPDVRETALHLPSARVHKISSEAPSPLRSTEEIVATAHISPTTAPKSFSISESVQHPVMTASPRPALRAEQGSQQNLPQLVNSKTTETEADIVPDAPVSHLPHHGSLSQKTKEDTTDMYEVNTESSISLSASEDGEIPGAEEITNTAWASQVDAIMDEEPPWKTEPMKTLELKDSRSSSDVECEKDVSDEKSESHDLKQVKEQQKSHVSKSDIPDVEEKISSMDKATSSVATQKPIIGGATKSAKSSGDRRSSFIVFCLLPTTLLLLGGIGQHVWHYGLPMSVAQLTTQLELHWLEGFALVPQPCSTDCRVHLIESIPVGLYQSSLWSKQSIADSWLHLLDKANSSVNIAAFYFTLRSSDSEFLDADDSQGRNVFEHLKQLESKGVNLQIAVNGPQSSTQDTVELAAAGAKVREVDLNAITGGIVHTKLWVVDQKHFYLGSANMDWRSLSQVKEVGLLVEDCSCLAQDAYRIFEVYWSIGGGTNGSLPPYWPARLSALSSSQNPLHVKFNGVPAQVYLSSAPPQISARGRSDDLSTILSVIGDAQKFVYISVMDYLPLSEFQEPLRFWSTIDTALRAAACTRGVQVRLMVSCWKHSPAPMFIFLQSLLVLNRPPLQCDINVKIFTVPSSAEQLEIPFARVNHAKFMVTDRVVYIGTSNWSENYFTHTAGVSLVVNQTGSEVGKGQQTLQSEAEELFLRDWRSQYASEVSLDSVQVCPHI
ncbi:phospholipase D3 isoform X2 [Mastacembelus armatus]|uniref:phospholipase D3 isoform X2 n=1 Tax=Mastacembelus armatus TaxID=205130 RepID=UPI000E457767|nr:phospholipase D3-like isoform X2 [Mastacembelus armatus]